MRKLKTTPMKADAKGSPELADLNSKPGTSEKQGFASKHKQAKRVIQERQNIEYLKYGDMIRMWIGEKENKMPLCLDSSSAEILYLKNSPTKDPQGFDLFRVVPPNPSSAFSSMRADMKRISKMKGAEAGDESKEVNIDGYKAQLKEQIPKIVHEQESKKGEAVLFNDQIQLMHVASKQFLKVSEKTGLSKQRKADEMKSYSLMLCEFSSAKTHFRILPLRDFQENSEIISSDSFSIGFEQKEPLVRTFTLWFSGLDEEKRDEAKACICYLYDGLREKIKFEIINESYINSHLCRDFNMKAVWITAAEEAFYLNLIETPDESVEKNQWNSLLPGYEEKKQEKGYSVYFEKYDKKIGNPPMSALWVVQLGTSQNEIIIRHLSYDIPLIKLNLEPIPRKENELSQLRSNSLFKIRGFDRREYITPGALKQDENDYYFAALQFITIGKEEETIVKYVKSKLNFLRSYATKKITSNSDLTNDGIAPAVHNTLTQLQALCKNSLPGCMLLNSKIDVPNSTLQMFMCQLGVFDVLATLLQYYLEELELASSYTSIFDRTKAAILCIFELIQLLVKDNQNNQLSALKQAMHVLVKYIGHPNMEDEELPVIFTLIENCEKLTVGNTYEMIINQCLEHLKKCEFSQRLERVPVLKILRKLCLPNLKHPMSLNQDILMKVLSIAEKSKGIFIDLSFSRETNHLLIKLDESKEIDACEADPNEVHREHPNLYHYLREQMALFADMSVTNGRVAGKIAKMFPMRFLIHNLINPKLDSRLKMGLLSIINSIVKANEEWLSAKRPKLLRWSNSEQLRTNKSPKGFSNEEFARLRNYINEQFKAQQTRPDLNLFYEFLSLVRYLLNNDLLFGECSSSQAWVNSLQSCYELLTNLFKCVCIYLHEMKDEKEEEDNEEEDEQGKAGEEENGRGLSGGFDNFNILFQYAQYYKFLLKKKKEKQNEEADEEVDKSGEYEFAQEALACFRDFTKFLEDAYLSAFVDTFSHFVKQPKNVLALQCKIMALKILTRAKPKAEQQRVVANAKYEYRDLSKAIDEDDKTGDLESLLKNFKDYNSMFAELVRENPKFEKENFFDLLKKWMSKVKDVSFTKHYLSVFNGYFFPNMVFLRNLKKLQILSDVKEEQKFERILTIKAKLVEFSQGFANMYSLQGTSAEFLGFLKLLEGTLSHLYSMFFYYDDKGPEFNSTLNPLRDKINFEEDEQFVIVFTQSKTYKKVIDFIKITKKLSKEAAKAYINRQEVDDEDNTQKFYEEILKIRRMCQCILIQYCKKYVKGQNEVLKWISILKPLKAPGKEESAEAWKRYSELTQPDLDLLFCITQSQSNIEMLTQSIEPTILKLIDMLSLSICTHNIARTFEILMNFYEYTTMPEVKKLTFSVLWNNEKFLKREDVMDISVESKPEALDRMKKLMKAFLIFTRSKGMRVTKSKLSDIFVPSILNYIAKRVLQGFDVTRNLDFMDIFVYMMQIYSDCFLIKKEEMPSDEDMSKFVQFFDEQNKTCYEGQVLRIKGQLQIVQAIFDITEKFLAICNEQQKESVEIYHNKLKVIISSNKDQLQEEKKQKRPRQELLTGEEEKMALLAKSIESRQSEMMLINSASESLDAKMKLREVIKRLLKDETIKKCEETEETAFADIMTNIIEELGEPELNDKKKQINKAFLKKLMSAIIYCVLNKTNRQDVKRIMVNCIKMIRRIEEVEPNKKRREKRMKAIADAVANFKLTEGFAQILMEKETGTIDALLPTILELANEILIQNYDDQQALFLKHIKNNKNSYLMYEKFYKAIVREIFIIEKPNAFAHRCIANQDYYKLIEMTLIFGKSLCEGHNDPLQQLMSGQPGKEKSFNIIVLLINYVGLLVNSRENKVGEEDSYEQNEYKRYIQKYMLLAMRAICESVSGPCRENQDLISETDVYKIGAKMLGIPYSFEIPGNLEPGNNFMKSKIKIECLTLLQTLMEGRKYDDKVLVLMKQHISESLLLDNLLYVYYAFKTVYYSDYTEELLLRAMKESVDSTVTDPFALELGFKICELIYTWYDEDPKCESTLFKKMMDIKAALVREPFEEPGTIASAVTFAYDFVYGFYWSVKAIRQTPKLPEASFKQAAQSQAFESEALDFFVKYTGRIEMVRNNKLQTVHFPLLPMVDFLNKNHKMQTIGDEFPVGQPQEKLNYMMERATDLIFRVRTEYRFNKIFSHYLIIGAVIKQETMWRNFSFYFLLILNALLLFSYRKEGEANDVYSIEFLEWVTPSLTKYLMKFIGFLLLISSSCIIFSSSTRLFMEKYTSINVKEKQQSARNEGQGRNAYKLVLKSVWEMLNTPIYMFYFVYFILAILGLLFHPFSYAFMMISIVQMFPRLLNVLKALWEPLGEIALSTLLMLVLEYMFTVVGYGMFQDNFPSHLCDSLVNCLLITIDQTFKSGGGIGGYLEETFYEVDGKVFFKGKRLIFDSFFNFMILILIVQIIAGVIINKFGELRDAECELENELGKVCMVCGQENSEIEKTTGVSFLVHVTRKHDIWMYMMYLSYVLKKPKEEYTGGESYIYDCYMKGENTWFPYNLIAEQGEKEILEDIQNEMKDVKDELKMLRDEGAAREKVEDKGIEEKPETEAEKE